jgi:hypothetical protein
VLDAAFSEARSWRNSSVPRPIKKGSKGSVWPVRQDLEEWPLFARWGRALRRLRTAAIAQAVAGASHAPAVSLAKAPGDSLTLTTKLDPTRSLPPGQGGKGDRPPGALIRA